MKAVPSGVPGKYNVFFSHAGPDTEAARQLAEILRRNGLTVWFDKDNLHPDDAWMTTIETAISGASAMVVYIGSLGIQNWVDREVRFGLVRNTEEHGAFRFIPVLGEGADPAKLPPFVQQHQFVDLRDSRRAPKEIEQLIKLLLEPSVSQPAVPAEYWTTHSPFRGLQTFHPDDSWLFFGRDHDTQELLVRLGRHPTLAVIANSGSGKSSLIQAGLIPSLRRGRFSYHGQPIDSWHIAVFRPSSSPFDELAETLPIQLVPESSTADRAESIDYFKKKLPTSEGALRNAIAALVGTKPQTSRTHILLVADQFEELFTLVPDAQIRNQYIDSLLAATRPDSDLSVHLMLVLRADFYGHCLDHPKLSACLDRNIYNVPLMSPPQLRETIESRLALAAAGAESGLIDALLSDVGSEPGNLALMEHALAQLWEKSGGPDHKLTNEAYAEIGRLKGALRRHADKVYGDLDKSDQKLAQRIFLELVQLGEGAQDTRRRVRKKDLLHLGDPQQVERLVSLLASKRLVATSGEGAQSPDESFVEVSHEALIREWASLREWLKENREDLRFGRSLLQAAEEWRELKEDPSGLITGIRLARGGEWLAKYPDQSPLLCAFFKASQAAEEEAIRKERDAQEREIARQKEIRQQAEARAEAETQLRLEKEEAAVQSRRSAIRSRRFSYALGLLFLMAVAFAWVARHQQLIARSQTMAAQAKQIMSSDPSKFDQAALLAIESLRLDQSSDARSILTDAIHLLPTFVHQVPIKCNDKASLSFGGEYVICIDNAQRSAKVILGATGQDLPKAFITPKQISTEEISSAAVSPDGRFLAVAFSEGAFQLWDMQSGQSVDLPQLSSSIDFQRLSHFKKGKRSLVAFSANNPDGQFFALGLGNMDSSAVFIVALSKPQTRFQTASLEGGIIALAFSSDGAFVAVMHNGKSATDISSFDVRTGQKIYDTKGGEALPLLAVSDRAAILAFSGNKSLVVGDKDRQVYGELRHNDDVTAIALTADGFYAASGSADGTAQVMEAGTDGRRIALIPVGSTVQSLAFTKNNELMVLSSGELKTFNVLKRPPGFESIDVKSPVAISPGGRYIASFDATPRQEPERSLGPEVVDRQMPKQPPVNLSTDTEASRDEIDVRFTQDESHLLVTYGKEKVVSFALPALPGEAGKTMAAPPDSRPFGVSGDGNVVAWAEADRIQIPANPKPLISMNPHVGALNPHGSVIAIASADKHLALYDVSTQREVFPQKTLNAQVETLQFSPEGKQVAAALADKTLFLWNALTGVDLCPSKDLCPLRADTSKFVFSDDGKLLVIGGGAENQLARDLQVIETASQKVLLHISQESQPIGVAIEPKKAGYIDIMDETSISRHYIDLNELIDQACASLRSASPDTIEKSTLDRACPKP